MGTEQREEAYWDSKAGFDWLIETDVDTILKDIPRPDGTSLELCAGSGMFTKRMDFSNSKRYICLDLSQKLLSRLKKDLRFVKTKKGDAQKIPFKNNTFDNLYVFAGLHHIPDIDLTLQRSYAVLRDRGNFICFEPNSTCFYRGIMLKLKHFLNHLYTEDEVFLNPPELVKKFENAGFTVTKLRYLTPTYKFSHVTWLYFFFIFMKLLAIIPSRHFQSFFVIIAEK